MAQPEIRSLNNQRRHRYYDSERLRNTIKQVLVVFLYSKFWKQRRMVILHLLTNISIHIIESFRDNFLYFRAVCFFIIFLQKAGLEEYHRGESLQIQDLIVLPVVIVVVRHGICFPLIILLCPFLKLKSKAILQTYKKNANRASSIIKAKNIHHLRLLLSS